jgi:hypothetical protein
VHSWGKGFIKRRFSKIALRLSIKNLPPVATHLACFLMGTLLFEPDSSGRVPPGILVPWASSKVQGGVGMARDYALIDGERRCLMLATNFKLWEAEEKKIFILVPKTRLLTETLNALQKSEARLLRLNSKDPSLPYCEKKNVIIYP